MCNDDNKIGNQSIHPLPEEVVFVINRSPLDLKIDDETLALIKKNGRACGAHNALVSVSRSDPEFFDVEYRRKYAAGARPFERIRRITGYLVGDLRRWNNAKQAEEHDRVIHGVNSTKGV